SRYGMKGAMDSLRATNWDAIAGLIGNEMRDNAAGSRRRRKRPGRMTSGQQPAHRRHGLAAGEDSLGERALLDAQVVLEHALDHGAQVGGGLEVARLVEVGGLEPGPVGDHAAALEGAARQDRDR